MPLWSEVYCVPQTIVFSFQKAFIDAYYLYILVEFTVEFTACIQHAQLN